VLAWYKQLFFGGGWRLGRGSDETGIARRSSTLNREAYPQAICQTKPNGDPHDQENASQNPPTAAQGQFEKATGQRLDAFQTASTCATGFYPARADFAADSLVIARSSSRR